MFIKQDNTLKWNWILWGSVITLALVLLCVFGLDKPLHILMYNPECNMFGYNNSGLCSVAYIIGRIFRVKVWLATTLISVLVFFLYKAFRNEFDFRYAFVKIKNSYVFYVMCSVLLAVFTTGILKVLIGRSRPVLFDALGHTYFVPGTFDTIFNSMPSGHTVVSFAGLVMIGMLFPRIKWATWTMAILIAISRVYIGAHWVGDVVFGAFIGMLCADIAFATLKKINKK